MTQIAQVPFHGTFLHTALGTDGDPVVVLKPTVEAMGLSWPAQHRKLQRRSWAVVAQTATTGSDGKTYLMDSCDLETWSMLLANIDENKVGPSARELVVRYQRESARVLRDYWTRGIGILPDTPERGTLTWEHVAALARADYGFNVSVGTLRQLLQQAGVLTTTGRPHLIYERLFRPAPSATRWDVYPVTVPWLMHQAMAARRTAILAEQQAQIALDVLRQPFQVEVGDGAD